MGVPIDTVYVSIRIRNYNYKAILPTGYGFLSLSMPIAIIISPGLGLGNAIFQVTCCCRQLDLLLPSARRRLLSLPRVYQSVAASVLVSEAGFVDRR